MSNQNELSHTTLGIIEYAGGSSCIAIAHGIYLIMANCLPMPLRLDGSGGYAFAMVFVPRTRPYDVADMIAQLCNNGSG